MESQNRVRSPNSKQDNNENIPVATHEDHQQENGNKIQWKECSSSQRSKSDDEDDWIEPEEEDPCNSVQTPIVHTRSSTEEEDEEEEKSIPQDADKQEPMSKPKIVFNLSNLPIFNMCKIITSLCVRERLNHLCKVNKRFRECVYQPQCFADISFFPVIVPSEKEGSDSDVQTRPPKMLRIQSRQFGQHSWSPTGITYVEVCMKSQHPFVSRVAKHAGMWNFKAELWDRVCWPNDLVMESLQLSLDSHTGTKVLDLRDGVLSTSQTKISNLFLIKFETEGHQPRIYFPSKLRGIGLQSFNSTCFGSTWWKKQVFFTDVGIFDSVLFLVLSCCDFQSNELQDLIHRMRDHLEHLSLRYVRWTGVLTIPSRLVSLGWFPEAGSDSMFRFEEGTSRLWQLQIRLSEHYDASIAMLNCVHDLCPDLMRISFEFIRPPEEWHAQKLDVSTMKVWDSGMEKMKRDGLGDEEDFDFVDERVSKMNIVVDPTHWKHQPELESVFVLSDDQFLNPNESSFLDCPSWSEEARGFIFMTARRKLLLR